MTMTEEQRQELLRYHNQEVGTMMIDIYTHSLDISQHTSQSILSFYSTPTQKVLSMLLQHSPIHFLNW